MNEGAELEQPENRGFAELAQKYFDALYFGDADLFAEIFHPEASLYSNHNNEFVKMNVAEYLELVRDRTNPADRGEDRDDRVLEFTQGTPTTGVLRTRELFRPKIFTDELTLIKFGSEWKIIAKIWDFELIDAEL